MLEGLFYGGVGVYFGGVSNSDFRKSSDNAISGRGWFARDGPQISLNLNKIHCIGI